MTTTTAIKVHTNKVHMISGTNDAVVCGGVRGNRTDDFAQVTCALCRAMLDRMSRVDAHLVALEVLDAVQRGRFNAHQTTAAKLRRAWLTLAQEKAEAEVARLEESVGLIREAAKQYATDVASLDPARPCLACGREACAQAGYGGIDKKQAGHTCGQPGKEA